MVAGWEASRLHWQVAGRDAEGLVTVGFPNWSRDAPADRFVAVHRSIVVNVDRVAELRRRPDGRDWELRLEPPVNRVVPVARGRLAALWAAYGDALEARPVARRDALPNLSPER